MDIRKLIEILGLAQINWSLTLLVVIGAVVLVAVAWVAWHILAGPGMAGCGWVTTSAGRGEVATHSEVKT